MKNYTFISVAVLIFLISWEVFFPIKLFKKQENFSISTELVRDSIKYTINPFFYKKNYLMSNGKYSDEKSIGYSEYVIPENIQQLSTKFSSKINLNKNELIARWTLISNFGVYSNGNNPFFISYSDTKKYWFGIPNSSVILSSYYKWNNEDSTFNLNYAKIASFPNLEICFQIYSELLFQKKIIDNYLFKQSLDSLTLILDNKKNYKTNLDSTKLILQGKDTIISNDSIKIYSYQKNESYKQIYIPNYLLLSLIILYLFYIYSKNKL